jgi:hypothetical protein
MTLMKKVLLSAQSYYSVTSVYSNFFTPVIPDKKLQTTRKICGLSGSF